MPDQNDMMDALGNWVVEQFNTEYAPFRDQFTREWINTYYRFLGKYREGELPKEKWRSKTFTKLTKVKCLASWAQMIRSIVQMTEFCNADALDGNKDAASGMAHEIDSQLDQSNFTDCLKVGSLEMSIYGNMIIQAPALEMSKNGIWTPQLPNLGFMGRLIPDVIMQQLAHWVYQDDPQMIPKVYNRNIFEGFPYPYASSPQTGPGFFHSCIVDKHYLIDLLEKPGFDNQVIAQLIKDGPEEVKSKAEDTADDRLFARGFANSGRKGYDLKFFTGRVDSDVLKKANPSQFQEIEGYKELWVWVIRHGRGNKVIKVVQPPLPGYNRPWFMTSFERLPYESIGIGVGENVKDMQELLNGATRMYIDAKKISMPQIAVNSSQIAEKGTIKMQPFKVWEFKGNPKDAMQSFSFQDVSNGLLDLIGLAERFADEISGQPKFSTGVDSSMYNKTAHGLSMLMNAQTQVLQGAIENMQTDIIDPIVKTFYNYNMMYSKNKAIKGHMNVTSNGLTAMMIKDTITQRMLQFLTFIINPVVLQNPYAVRLLRQVGANMDIPDVDKVLPPRELVEAEANMTEQSMFAAIKGMSVPPGAPGPEMMGSNGVPTSAVTAPMPPTATAGPGGPAPIQTRVAKQNVEGNA